MGDIGAIEQLTARHLRTFDMEDRDAHRRGDAGRRIAGSKLTRLHTQFVVPEGEP